MAHIRPFKALHPTTQHASTIAALPYDVQSTEEARMIIKDNPLSFLAIDEPAANFPRSQDPYSDIVYDKAAELFEHLKETHEFVSDDAEHFYLYELTRNGVVQNGIVACVNAQDFDTNIVRRHENTRLEKEMDRVRHIDCCNAQTGPILLAYHNSDQINRLCEAVKQQESFFDFVADDGIRHRGFRFDEQAECVIADSFADMAALYIADGHHRSAAAVTLAKKRNQIADETKESAWILSVLFSDEELTILPYERLVKDLNGHTEDEFIAWLTENFHAQVIVDNEEKPVRVSTSNSPSKAEELIAPQTKGEFCVYLNDRWYRCQFNKNKSASNSVDSLDVALLQNEILTPYFSIEDVRASKRIAFMGGIRGLKALEEACANDYVVAFALYPTSMKELIAVADDELLMPPKSTWFEPKLRSGLFIHEL